MQLVSAGSRQLGVGTYTPNRPLDSASDEAMSLEFHDFFYKRILPETDQKKVWFIGNAFNNQDLGTLWKNPKRFVLFLSRLPAWILAW